MNIKMIIRTLQGFQKKGFTDVVFSSDEEGNEIMKEACFLPLRDETEKNCVGIFPHR